MADFSKFRTAVSGFNRTDVVNYIESTSIEHQKALRKLTGAIGKSNAIVIFINQLREKIGVMYGNPETTPGGRALKFYSSVRLDVRRTEQLKAGGEVIGNRVRVKVVKNKVAPPFKEAEFDIMYGQGVSRLGEILDLGSKLDIVQKSGAWFNYGEIRLGQGRDNAKEYLRQNPELAEEIAAKVMANADKLMGRTAAAAAPKKLGPDRRGGRGRISRSGQKICRFLPYGPRPAKR